MAHKSAIEWTDATWNPWHGCHKVSAGCKNCYMFRDKARYGQDPNVVVRAADKTFYAPLKWAEPKKIFTCSWSDFFIEEADPWRDEAFAIMALTPQHTYQVLTKRPDRMLEWFRGRGEWPLISMIFDNLPHARGEKAFLRSSHASIGDIPWPLPNVWLGVSIEDQKTTDERIPLLLETPAAKRFLSIEPLLGPVDLRDALSKDPVFVPPGSPEIHWVIAGGESGPNARPTHPDWIRSIRDQSTAAGVAFHFKQWGEHWPFDPLYEDQHPFGEVPKDWNPKLEYHWTLENPQRPSGYDYVSIQLGKKAAGRLLDGREWNEMPEVSR